jgi:hypothetical protein
VDVDAVASAWRYSRTSGLPVAVSFSNASLRPIIVRRARLWLQDYQLGVAKVYSTEASAVDPGIGAPETPSRYGTTKFPFTMHIREGRTVVIFIEDRGRFPRCMFRPERVAPAKRPTCKRWRTALTAGDSKSGLQLALRLKPGGVKRYPVRLEDPPVGWTVRGRFRRSGVVLGLRRDAAEPMQAAIFRLDVWGSGATRYHRGFERPLIGRATTNIFVGALQRGSYMYVFRVGGRVIRGGCFQIPPKTLECR